MSQQDDFRFSSICLSGWWPPLFDWRAQPISEALAGGVGYLAGVLQIHAPRIPELKRLLGKAVIPILFGALVLGPYLKPMLQPPPWDEFDTIWLEGVCKQSTAYSCGPCSVATLLKLKGLSADEKALARDVHCSRRGSEPWHLARALRSRGFDVSFLTADAQTEPLPYPAIAGVALNGIDHVIPILGKRADRYVIGDPVFGREILTREQLLKRYRFSGLFIWVHDS